MEKIKGILAAAIMLYIISGIFVTLYQLLVFNEASKLFLYTLLIALALLKGAIVSLHRQQPVKELTHTDTLHLKCLLRVVLLLFTGVLLVSYLLKHQWICASLSVIPLLLLAFKNKHVNPFTSIKL